MQYRQFGKTALRVSEVGFGAWAIGGNAMIGNTAIGWGKADDQLSIRAIRAALDAGINFFDTADIYGLGHSETLIGNELGNRPDVVIATKVGNVSRNEKFTTDYSAQYIIKACEASLRRLKRDVIDYYQLHSARLVHLQQAECVAAMEELKKAGKIRYWGLSLNTFHPEPEAEYLMKNGLADGFQLVFNIINQKALNLIEQAGEKGLGIIARMPLQFGLLTGKFERDAKFERDDHRSNRLTPEILDQALDVLEQHVWPVAERNHMSKVALALSFVLSVKGVSTVIPGIRTPQHVAENTTGLQQLDAKTMQRLLQLRDTVMDELMQKMETIG